MTAKTNTAPATINLKLADKELEAEKQWQLAGSPEDSKPETPTLDSIRSTYAVPKRARRSGGGEQPNPMDVRLVRNGKPVPMGNNVWSRIAYHFSPSINGGDRLSSAELTARLNELGVDDPQHTEWDVEMCDGVRWATVKLDDTKKLTELEAAAKTAKPAPAKRAAAKPAPKSTTKKPTAKPAAKKTPPAKKSTTTTKTARGKEQVTPIPKKQPTPKRQPKSKLSDVKPDAPVATPETSGTLAQQAAAERKLLAQWTRDGEKGTRPATPAIDELAAKSAAA
jgi:hypothetical protein